MLHPTQELEPPANPGRFNREYYPLQVELDMCGDAVHRDVEDGNRMTVVHDFATMEDVKRYMSLPNLKELMDKIG